MVTTIFKEQFGIVHLRMMVHNYCALPMGAQWCTSSVHREYSTRCALVHNYSALPIGAQAVLTVNIAPGGHWCTTIVHHQYSIMHLVHRGAFSTMVGEEKTPQFR